jgi:hypothetical protein
MMALHICHTQVATTQSAVTETTVIKTAGLADDSAVITVVKAVSESISFILHNDKEERFWIV